MKWSQAGLLKELREGKGWSQKQLAEVSGLSQQAIAHWELGDREPSASNLFTLCHALGVSCERFAEKNAGKVSEPTPARPRGRPRAGEEAEAKKPMPPEMRSSAPPPVSLLDFGTLVEVIGNLDRATQDKAYLRRLADWIESGDTSPPAGEKDRFVLHVMNALSQVPKTRRAAMNANVLYWIKTGECPARPPAKRKAKK